MKTISIQQKLNSEHAITEEQGRTIFKLINPILQNNEPVELDFIGIEIKCTSFWHNAIGNLFRDNSIEIINKNLQFKNLTNQDLQLIKDTKYLAIKLYKKPQQEPT